MCGLTLQDIDFKNRKINIDHQLIRTKKMEYIIETQKNMILKMLQVETT